MQSTFIIGNGINRVDTNNSISWGGLLKSLQKKFDSLHIDLTNDYKPFPLSFEEILFATKGTYNENLEKLKNEIAKSFEKAEPNLFHQRLVRSGVNNIITTNYDYNFEKCIIPNFHNEFKLSKRTRETKYSIRRRCFFDEENISVWHIHGELNHKTNYKNSYPSQSILIGYDHYVEYLSQIQSYLYGDKYEGEDSIKNKLLNNFEEGSSWIDKLFFDRVVILGLDLDFSEIDVWWLLNFRKKTIKENNLKENEIIYYQPRLPQLNITNVKEEMTQNNKELKIKAKKDVLESLSIKFEEVLCNDYKDFYNQVYSKENIK